MREVISCGDDLKVQAGEEVLDYEGVSQVP